MRLLGTMVLSIEVERIPSNPSDLVPSRPKASHTGSRTSGGNVGLQHSLNFRASLYFLYLRQREGRFYRSHRHTP